MINLLKSNFYRLKKSKTFLSILTIFALLSIFLYFNNYTPNCVNCENQLGDVFFTYLVLICLLMPIFIFVFISSDYNSGTIRNKIICGHSRTSIYLSNLIISIIVSIIYSVVSIICIIVVANMFDNTFIISTSKFIYLLLDGILMSISICSIFTFMSMLISTRNLSSIYSLSLTMFALIFISNISYKISISTGIKKQILTFIYDFIPMGQAYQIMELTNNWLIIGIYSILLNIIINILGIIMFNKKQIN